MTLYHSDIVYNYPVTFFDIKEFKKKIDKYKKFYTVNYNIRKLVVEH